MEPTQSLESGKLESGPELWGGADAAEGPGSTGRGGHVADGDVGDLVIDDLLVEEISIDGMCGVY